MQTGWHRRHVLSSSVQNPHLSHWIDPDCETVLCSPIFAEEVEYRLEGLIFEGSEFTLEVLLAPDKDETEAEPEIRLAWTHGKEGGWTLRLGREAEALDSFCLLRLSKKETERLVSVIPEKNGLREGFRLLFTNQLEGIASTLRGGKKVKLLWNSPRVKVNAETERFIADTRLERATLSLPKGGFGSKQSQRIEARILSIVLSRA